MSECKTESSKNKALWQLVKDNDLKMARYYFKLANGGIDYFTTYQERY